MLVQVAVLVLVAVVEGLFASGRLKHCRPTLSQPHIQGCRRAFRERAIETAAYSSWAEGYLGCRRAFRERAIETDLIDDAGTPNVVL